MKYVIQVSQKELLRSCVAAELKNHGLKMPKFKKTRSKQDIEKVGKIFGVPISSLPSVVVDENGMCVPRVIVDTLLAIEQDITAEFIFRKTGTVARQKELKKLLESGQTGCGMSVHDHTSIVKQFLREMPEPLIPVSCQECFTKALNLDNVSTKTDAILLLCLLLPMEHIHVLRYFMQYLHLVSSHSQYNKMDAQNLAMMVTPNITHFSGNLDKGNNDLKARTEVIRILILNGNRVGMVPSSLLEKIESSTTGGESAQHGDNCVDQVPVKHKRRKSINGVLNNLRRKVNQSKTATQGNSLPSTPLSVFNSGNMTPTQPILTLEDRSSAKRKANGDLDATPQFKRRAMMHDADNSASTPMSFGTPWAGIVTDIKPAVVFSLDPPKFNFLEEGEVSFTSNTDGTFKTPKDRAKFKRLFSPGRFSKRNGIPIGSRLNAKRGTPQSQFGMNIHKSSISTADGMVPKICTEPTGNGGNADVPRKEESIQFLNNKVIIIVPPLDSDVSIASTSNTAVHKQTPEDEEVLPKTLDICTPLQSNVQHSEGEISGKLNANVMNWMNNLHPRSPCPKKVGSKSVRVKGSARLAITLCGDESPKMKLRRSISSLSCNSEAVKSVLRRGRPNTVLTGLPQPSPFKKTLSRKERMSFVLNFSQDDDDDERMILGTPSKDWLQDVFCTDRKFNAPQLIFGETIDVEESEGQKRSTSIENKHPSGMPDMSGFKFSIFESDQDKNNASAVGSCESLCLTTSTASQHNSFLSGPLSYETDGSCGKLKLSEEETSMEDVLEDNDDEMEGIAYKNENKSRTVAILDTPSHNSVTYNKQDECREYTDGSKQTIRSVFMRNKRCISTSSISNNKHPMTKRHLSETDMKRIGSAVLAPLTNETYAILTGVGALPEDSSSETDTVADLQETTWQPAPDVLMGQEIFPPGGRPSLILLKKERAGMVSASVQKYNSISRDQPTTPRATDASRTPNTPVRVPNVFFRSSTYKSTRRQSKGTTELAAPKLPMTNFVRKQSLKRVTCSPQTNGILESSSHTNQRHPLRESNILNRSKNSPTGQKQLNATPDGFKKPSSTATPRNIKQARNTPSRTSRASGSTLPDTGHSSRINLTPVKKVG